VEGGRGGGRPFAAEEEFPRLDPRRREIAVRAAGA
jgi:hypothetical protein